jgi:hypothetical protein
MAWLRPRFRRIGIGGAGAGGIRGRKSNRKITPAGMGSMATRIKGRDKTSVFMGSTHKMYLS